MTHSTLIPGESTSAPDVPDGNAALAERSAAHLSPVLARYYQRGWVRGAGHRLWDADGKEYLDFACGLAVTILGHAHPRVSAAIHAQTDSLLHMCNGLGYLQPVTDLADALVATLPASLDSVFFANSGGGHRSRRQARSTGDRAAGHHRLLGGIPRPDVRAAEPDHQQPQLPGRAWAVPARDVHQPVPERLSRLRRR